MKNSKTKRNWIIAGISFAVILILGLLDFFFFHFLFGKKSKASDLIETNDSSNPPNTKYPNPLGESRGYRNNNPGNIILTAENWEGEINPSSDVKFMQFSEMRYGYRALFRLISNYIRNGLNTLTKIGERYDKGVGYPSILANLTGINPDKILTNDEDTLRAIVKALATNENGKFLYEPDYEKGYDLHKATS